MFMNIPDAQHLEKRYSCYYQNGYRYCGYSAWDSWARWLVLGLVVGGFLFFFIIFSCISARRRRKMGYAPYRGTGWAAGAGHGQPQYNQNVSQPYYANQQPSQYNNNAAPPPVYGNNNQTGGAAASYYGNGGVSQPANTYNPGQESYKAPPGPPPNHVH